MLATFGDDLRIDWLLPKLQLEGSVDACEARSAIAGSAEPVTEESLPSLIDQLRQRPGGQ